MDNKFKKGLILGGILAALATIGFAITKEGQQLTEELQKDVKALAKNLKKGLHSLQDITKEKFDELVTTVVDEYAEKKKMAGDAKQKLITALQAKWHDMEKEYQAEKDQAKK